MNEPSVARRHFLVLSAATVAAHAALTVAASPVDKGTVCVLGATGHVGDHIVRQALTAGFTVVAVSRTPEKLKQLAARAGALGQLETVQGDMSLDEQAAALSTRLVRQFGSLRAVVASLSSAQVDGPMHLLDSPTQTLRKAFDSNFFTHITAARGLIPALATGGTYIGINGGLADFARAGMAQLTTTQSALRAAYEVLSVEAQDPKRPADRRPNVRVLELYGLVDDGNAPTPAQAMRIEGAAVGRRVVEVISEPQRFPGPVLAVKSKAFT